MINLKRFVPVVILTLVMAAAFTACADNSNKSSQSTSGPAPTSSPVRDIKSDLELDTNRSLAVAVVQEVSEGPFARGQVTLTERGVKCQELKCDVLYFYDEARLKALCKADNADCRYNQYSWFESRGDLVMDENFYKKAKEGGSPVIYKIYLDWHYKDTVEVGDTILVNLGTLLNQNPNEGTTETPQHHLVVEPFGVEPKSPMLAKFVDGRLQLPEELKASLNLRRLYDDSEPERTAIKDGDSVDDVIAFIKCVEQDVERYRSEHAGR